MLDMIAVVAAKKCGVGRAVCRRLLKINGTAGPGEDIAVGMVVGRFEGTVTGREEGRLAGIAAAPAEDTVVGLVADQLEEALRHLANRKEPGQD